MSLYGAIRTRLQAVTGVTDLVGTRVYWLRAKQGAVMPYIVLQRVGGNAEHLGGNDSIHERARMQVSSWDEDSAVAESVGVEVSTALSRWSGTADGTTVIDILRQNELHDDDPETKQFRTLQDFHVWYVR